MQKKLTSADAENSSTGVLLVEDNADVRHCLTQDINNSANFHLVSAVGSLQDAKSVAPHRYQFVLLDLHLTDGHGVDMLKFLNACSHRAKIKVLVLSALGDKDSILNAIQAGADGYILKDSAPEEIITAMTQVATGDAITSPPVTRVLMNQIQPKKKADKQEQQPDSPSQIPPLTRREFEVLTSLAQGQSYKKIALNMDISLHTVSFYTKQLYTKLGVHSKNEAIYKAVNCGVISL